MANEDVWVCRKCKTEKPKSEFYKSPKRKAGIYPYCKPCTIADVQRNIADPGKRAAKNEYYRQRYQRIKESRREQDRARYERNRERVIQQAKEWAEQNREKRRTISQHYKHRRRAQEKDGISYSELETWKRAQPKRCYWCGKDCKRGFVVDHYTPLAKGGKHEASNLVIACRSCNSRKSARDPLEFAQSVGRLL